MNKIIKLFFSLAVISLILSSCTPDDYNLGTTDVKSEDLVEGIAYTIEHDAQNPNIIYLKSLMGNQYTPVWTHPQGRSQSQIVTLKIPFAGTYEVEFGVETPGGIVYGAKVTFEVADMYAGFISDEVWTMVAGGAGESKTWYLDLDADAVSRHFLGPIYFFTNTYTWDALHTASGDNYLDATVWKWDEAIAPLGNEDGSDAEWKWLADYPGNTWMCDAADFGTMTFDLIGGANISVDQEAYGLGTYSGSYLLDTENHTIAFTDAYPVHDSNRDAEMKEATEFRILYLTEDFMQIMVVPSGVCYNYISKFFRDNWTPGEEAEPEPSYDGDANSDLTTSTTTTKKWTLSLSNPYDWANLDGSLMNGWKTPEDYAATGWAPYDESLIENISLIMTKTGDNSGTYIFTDGNGDETNGSYTIDEKNNIDFGQYISFTISGWVSLATTVENTLRLISTETDALGSITGIWLGQRSTEKDEYSAYHFEPAASQDGTTDPDAALKDLLCAKIWKLDMDGTVQPDGDGQGGPITFTDEAYSWTWWPAPGTHYGAGDAGADYGTMKFDPDGTVSVNQNVITGGTTESSQTLDGTWTYDPDTKKVTMSVGMLHPSTASYAVADWGDTTLKSVSSGYLRLGVMRSEELSGEGAAVMMYNFIPAE